MSRNFSHTDYLLDNHGVRKTDLHHIFDEMYNSWPENSFIICNKLKDWPFKAEIFNFLQKYIDISINLHNINASNLVKS